MLEMGINKLGWRRQLEICRQELLDQLKEQETRKQTESFKIHSGASTPRTVRSDISCPVEIAVASICESRSVGNEGAEIDQNVEVQDMTSVSDINELDWRRQLEICRQELHDHLKEEEETPKQTGICKIHSGAATDSRLAAAIVRARESIAGLNSSLVGISQQLVCDSTTVANDAEAADTPTARPKMVSTSGQAEALQVHVRSTWNAATLQLLGETKNPAVYRRRSSDACYGRELVDSSISAPAGMRSSASPQPFFRERWFRDVVTSRAKPRVSVSRRPVTGKLRGLSCAAPASVVVQTRVPEFQGAAPSNAHPRFRPALQLGVCQCCGTRICTNHTEAP